MRYLGLGRNQEQTRFDGTLNGALLRFGNGRMGSRDALRQLGIVAASSLSVPKIFFSLLSMLRMT